jgi:lipopolysaccharide transport system ATP-binding protein
MGSISQLCTQAIFLKNATLHAAGSVEECVQHYLQGQARPDQAVVDIPQHDAQFWLRRLRLLNDQGKETNHFGVKDGVNLELHYTQYEIQTGLEIGYRVATTKGVRVFTSQHCDEPDVTLLAGKGMLRARLSDGFLNPGSYQIAVWAHVPGKRVIFLDEAILQFKIDETGSLYSRYFGADYGLVQAPCMWTSHASTD